MSQMQGQLISALVNQIFQQLGAQLASKVQSAAAVGTREVDGCDQDQLLQLLFAGYRQAKQQWVNDNLEALLLEAAMRFDEFGADKIVETMRRGVDNSHTVEDSVKDSSEKESPTEKLSDAGPSRPSGWAPRSKGGRHWGIVKTHRLVAFLLANEFTVEKGRTGEQSYRHVNGARIWIPKQNGDVAAGTMKKIVRRLEEILECELALVGGDIRQVEKSLAS